jgi:hypothetical protein
VYRRRTALPPTSRARPRLSIVTHMSRSSPPASPHCVPGVVPQLAQLHQMIYDVAELIELLSAITALQPGDLIFTGTPANVGALASRLRIDRAQSRPKRNRRRNPTDSFLAWDRAMSNSCRACSSCGGSGAVPRIRASRRPARAVIRSSNHGQARTSSVSEPRMLTPRVAAAASAWNHRTAIVVPTSDRISGSAHADATIANPAASTTQSSGPRYSESSARAPADSRHGWSPRWCAMPRQAMTWTARSQASGRLP